LIIEEHNSFVTIVKGQVTLLTNVSRYMDTLSLTIRGEEAMLLYKEEKPIMLIIPELQVSNKRHHLNHKF